MQYKLSIVVPCFNEEGNLEALARQSRPVLDELTQDWEMILVDDGSSDGTWETIRSIHEQFPNIKGLRLSRNFGHQFALFAGLRAASGDAVITMDGDLQHPPSVIPELVRQWRAGFMVVNTLRLDGAETGVFKRVTSKLYYKLFSFLSGVELGRGMADFRLLDRKVVDQLADFREVGLFLRGLVQWVGFPATSVEFQCGERYSGSTKYSLKRMLKFAWHGVTSFSIVPLRTGILIGLMTALLSFAYLSKAVLTKILFGTTVPGWASTVGILSFLFGVLFIFLGILGEYIGRILEQVRARPLFIVSERIGIREPTVDTLPAGKSAAA